jgi:hypothetical protein
MWNHRINKGAHEELLSLSHRDSPYTKKGKTGA